MGELAKLVKQRGRVKAKLTAFGNFLTSLDAEPQRRVELTTRIEKAEALWTEFNVIQNKIEDLEESEEQLAQRINFEDAYYATISRARNVAMTNQIAQQNIQPIAGPIEPLVFRPNVKLPNIELPKFDGNYERWIPFRDLFESLIASTALSPVQKLHYM